MKGVVLCATAMVAPLGLKATASPAPVGNVAGLATLVPNPALDQGYAVMYGELACATAIAEQSGLKATP